MGEVLGHLKPELIWNHFEEITKHPRPSKQEEKVVKYVLEFGKKLNLNTSRDKFGNIVIKKPATPGKENAKTIVMQGHLDMVCEKNSSSKHNFETDPIQAWVDGDWIKANDTTLGADNGIGIAAQLALLADNTIPHGPVECLFTVDEETGLNGAKGLESGFFESRILINLDSEDEGAARFLGQKVII